MKNQGLETRPRNKCLGLGLRAPGRKQIARGLPALGALLFSLCSLADYAVDWSTADGGGATSSGGVYSVSGTIGQPDAGGPLAGGMYSVTGGFWVLPQAVQTEGAPMLTIACGTPGYAVISWTPASTNWVLQERVCLTEGSWSNCPSGPANPTVVPATPPARFFRLFNVDTLP